MDYDQIRKDIKLSERALLLRYRDEDDEPNRAALRLVGHCENLLAENADLKANLDLAAEPDATAGVELENLRRRVAELEAEQGWNTGDRPKVLNDWPIWRLIVLLADLEREVGPRSSTAVVVARVLGEKLRPTDADGGRRTSPE